MNIAIIGTRGIPNHYGGFEQFAQYLSLGLVKRGHRVTVYNSKNHPYQQSDWNGVKIIHCYDPEEKCGTAGQFIYDLNCIRNTRKHNYDIILQLGYTSSSIWGWLLPFHKSVITTNMDGLEWKRSKYSKPVQRFLLHAERTAVKYSHHLISDSLGIKRYLKLKYNRTTTYIPYGADLVTNPSEDILLKYDLEPNGYNMLVARLEPENNIEMVLDGHVLSKSQLPFLIIGNHNAQYGDYLQKRYHDHPSIRFIGGLYDIQILNSLRYYSQLYFHGHSVGGTNPSLLEAMSSYALICAHQNIFNRSILEKHAFYFSTHEEVAQLILNIKKEDHRNFIEINARKIQNRFSWETVIEQYLEHFRAIKEERDLFRLNIGVLNWLTPLFLRKR